ncbi:MAG: orotate phosphoribosyltransferase [Chloroflexi bacterium]|nr:orotate phosphoribosyltransferase [Chloroflexota bacterium]
MASSTGSRGTTKVERILRDSGALLEGHFLLTSGLHSPYYVEKFHVLQHPRHTQALGRLIADNFRGAGAQVVAGPTTGGVIVAYEVARQLGVRSIFAEPGDQGRVFRRFTLAPGEKVLVVDDVLTTGGSVQDVLAEVRRCQGVVVGVGVLVDRSDGVDLGVPLFSCHRMRIPTYQPQDCPLCAKGLPFTKPGASA